MAAWVLTPLDEAQARAIVTWRYVPPYDIYNLGSGDVEETVQALLDPQNAYHALSDEAGALLAYCCYGPDARVPGGDYGAVALDVGLGVRPDLTGQGRGHTFVAAVLQFGRRTFAPVAWRVTVAGFNRRALRVWEQAGFEPVQTFNRLPDGREFVILTALEASC